MTYPVRGLHYGPALAVTLWTQAGSIPGNQVRAGSVVLGSFTGTVVLQVWSLCAAIPVTPHHHHDDGSAHWRASPYLPLTRLPVSGMTTCLEFQ